MVVANRHTPCSMHLLHVTYLTHKNDYRLGKKCFQVYTSVTPQLDADIAKRDTRCRGNTRGTAALQENLESSSLGSDGILRLLLQNCPMLPPFS